MEIKSLTLIRRIDGIKIFFEKPSDKHQVDVTKSACGEGKRIDACDLFSLFTANILKQDVLFIR